MKSFLATLFTIATLGAFAQQPLNGGFEAWADSTHPDHWSTLTQAFQSFGVTYTTLENKDTNDYTEGSASLRLMTDTVNAGGPSKSRVSGRVCYGGINAMSGAPVYTGVPYTLRPDSFQFDFRYMFGAGGIDSAYAEIMFTKFQNDSTKLVGVTAFLFSDTSYVDWYGVSEPINWLIPGVSPDTMRIRFFSSLSQVKRVGSTLWLDAVKVIKNPTGISETAADNAVVTYPNPANDKVTFDVAAELANGKVQVMDLNGRVVATEALNGRKQTLLTNEWPSGQYTYRITSKDKITEVRGKISVQK